MQPAGSSRPRQHPTSRSLPRPPVPLPRLQSHRRQAASEPMPTGPNSPSHLLPSGTRRRSRSHRWSELRHRPIGRGRRSPGAPTSAPKAFCIASRSTTRSRRVTPDPCGNLRHHLPATGIPRTATVRTDVGVASRGCAAAPTLSHERGAASRHDGVPSGTATGAGMAVRGSTDTPGSGASDLDPEHRPSGERSNVFGHPSSAAASTARLTPCPARHCGGSSAATTTARTDRANQVPT